MNLSNLDFNLLKVLDALIAERNVTRAGKRLGRSQPAVSNALQRLRHLMSDELLVRGAHGFVLTPRFVGERIGMSPLMVIFALLAFGHLLGFVGVLIALPLSAVAAVAVRRLHRAYLASSLFR